MGRFLSVDPVMGGTENDYVYPVNPIGGNDFSGLCKWCSTQKSTPGVKYSVYVGKNISTGSVDYVGHTKQSVTTRASQHQRSSSTKANLKFTEVASYNTKAEARIAEQSLKNYYSPKENKIDPISTKKLVVQGRDIDGIQSTKNVHDLVDEAGSFGKFAKTMRIITYLSWVFDAYEVYSWLTNPNYKMNCQTVFDINVTYMIPIDEKCIEYYEMEYY